MRMYIQNADEARSATTGSVPPPRPAEGPYRNLALSVPEDEARPARVRGTPETGGGDDRAAEIAQTDLALGA